MQHALPTNAARGYPVIRVEGTKQTTSDDAVAIEEPLEIRVGGEPLAVTMRTPGHDEELAAGFCLTEGIITEPAELAMVDRCHDDDGENVVLVELASEAMHKRRASIQRATREQYLSSSCGICGKQSIDRIRQHIPTLAGNFTVQRSTLEAWPDEMRQAQATFAQTGGLHAAALFTPDGTLAHLREDVGRHNAVDKVVGRLVLDGRVPFDPGVLLVSGRASFEIMQKAAMAGITVVAAISAPSSLAVDFAQAFGMTLVGFLRPGRMNIYAGQQRIVD